MVCFLLLLYMPWPKITWERKGLFALHVLDTVHSWGKSGRKKFRVGTWSKELKQRQWRNIAYWFTFRGSLTSHFIQVRGYPGVSPTTVEWAFPYQMVNQENASPTRHWPMWWKKFLNCGFFFPKKHNLCWADKNQHHAEISCKFGISVLYAPTRFRCGFFGTTSSHNIPKWSSRRAHIHNNRNYHLVSRQKNTNIICRSLLNRNHKNACRRAGRLWNVKPITAPAIRKLDYWLSNHSFSRQ